MRKSVYKTVSLALTLTLAAGAVGVAYYDTKDYRVIYDEAGNAYTAVKSGTSVISAYAAASSEKEADLLQSIIATQLGSDDTGVDKDESVYVIADVNGAVKEVIVSDWLRNTSNEAVIDDVSELDDIVNVKGDETYSTVTDGIVWNADGADIYYQGRTDKELPVDVNISYYLDGEETAPEDLSGKSGHVRIRFDYDNRAVYKALINDEETEVYVPFTMMTALMLPVSNFTNITVTNGKVMSEGSNNIVLGLAFPGLTDSLDLDREKLEDKDIEIPEYFEVEADAEDFSLDMTLTVALSDALSDIHLTDQIDLSSIEESMDDLKDATAQLEDGTKELADGVRTLSEKTGEFNDGAAKLYDGIVEYTDGAVTLSEGIDTLKSGTSDLVSGADKLKSGANTLSSGASDLNNAVKNISLPSVSGLSDEQKARIAAAAAADSEGKLDGAASQVADGVTSKIAGNVAGNDSVSAVSAGISGATSNDELMAGILGQLHSNIGTTITDEQYTAIIKVVLGTAATPIASGITKNISNNIVSDDTKSVIASTVKTDALIPVAQAAAVSGAEGVMSEVGSTISGFSSKLDELKSGTSKLASGASELASGVSTLSDGAGKLDSGASELQSGASTLISHNAELRDGAKELLDGTVKLTDGVDELLTGANDLNDGMIEFDKEGIEKLTSAFEDEGEKVVDRLNATMDAGKSYHSFTGLAEGKTGSVKFIIRTEAIN